MSFYSRYVVIAMAVVIALLIIAYLIVPSSDRPLIDRGATQGTAPTTTPPEITDSMKNVLETSKGFKVLISYTDRGFEPADVTILKGDSVRFANNSKKDVWISATKGESGAYPGVSGGCAESALNSCIALKPNDIWEFTFEKSGSWSYRNMVDTNETGVVRVR